MIKTNSINAYLLIGRIAENIEEAKAGGEACVFH